MAEVVGLQTDGDGLGVLLAVEVLLGLNSSDFVSYELVGLLTLVGFLRPARAGGLANGPECRLPSLLGLLPTLGGLFALVRGDVGFLPTLLVLLPVEGFGEALLSRLLLLPLPCGTGGLVPVLDLVRPEVCFGLTPEFTLSRRFFRPGIDRLRF